MNRLLKLILLMAIVNDASAYQYLKINEEHPIIAKISIKDPSRIAIKNGKIKFLKVKEDELTIEPDKELGEVTILPKNANESISVFIVDENNRTYSLILQQVDIPSESIVLDTGNNDKLQEILKKERAEAQPSKNYAYEKKIAAMLEFMAGKPKETNSVDIKKMSPEEIKLWKNTRFFKVGSFKGQLGIYRGVEADKYRLFNISKDKIILEEQEFYKDGVAAISIETPELEPNMSTFIYVIKAEVPNE